MKLKKLGKAAALTIGASAAAYATTNVTLKVMQRTGGSLVGAVWLAVPVLVRPMRILFSPVSLTK